MKKKTIRSITEGKEVYLIKLGKSGLEVKVDKEDWDLIRDLGLTASWNINPNGYVVASSNSATGCNISVGRVILDAGRGVGVRYNDGDKLDLRRENLHLVEDRKAFRRDRDYISPKEVRIDPEIVTFINQ